jgi:hypothetical protein
LHIPGGEDSPVWNVLSDHGADLYLCGEIHNTSIKRRDNVHQITHGVNPAAANEFNYLVVTVYPDSLGLEIKKVTTIIEGPKDKSLDPYGEDPYRARIIHIPDKYRESGMESIGSMMIIKSEAGKHFRYDRGIFSERVR